MDMLNCYYAHAEQDDGAQVRAILGPACCRGCEGGHNDRRCVRTSSKPATTRGWRVALVCV